MGQLSDWTEAFHSDQARYPTPDWELELVVDVVGDTHHRSEMPRCERRWQCRELSQLQHPLVGLLAAMRMAVHWWHCS